MKNKVKSILRDLVWFGGGISTSTHAIGGGEWSIEVSVDDSYCCEFVGSNGTRDGEEADDLHSMVTEAISQAEAVYEFINARWPERIPLIRLHSQMKEYVPEIEISDRISAFADAGGVHLVIVDGKPVYPKKFLKTSSKEEIGEFVRGCVKAGIFFSSSILPGHYGRQARRDRHRLNAVPNRG